MDGALTQHDVGSTIAQLPPVQHPISFRNVNNDGSTLLKCEQVSKTHRRRNNMPKIGPMELVIVLVVVVLIFGVGRLGRLGRDLGEGIREFQRGITGEEGEAKAGAED
jgi:sec-independent protein translocase protein TatA